MGMDKRLFLLISIFILAILLVGVAYAKNDKDKPMKDTSIKWDNKGDFIKIAEQEYGKYEIFDSIFLGVGKGKKLMDIELKENTETCTQNCYAIKDITLYEDGSLVDDVLFKTLQQDGSWVEQSIRKYQFYIKQPIVDVVVQDYNLSCTPIQYYDEIEEIFDIFNDCSYVYVGTHIEKSPEWIPYELGVLLPAGTYTLKLEGEKRPIRIVDWVIQSQGIWTTDWATWGNISLGDEAEVRLNTPANNHIITLDNNIHFNCSGIINQSVGANITNISLWDNSTGIWKLNQSQQLAGGSHEYLTLFTMGSGNDAWITVHSFSGQDLINSGFFPNQTINWSTEIGKYCASQGCGMAGRVRLRADGVTTKEFTAINIGSWEFFSALITNVTWSASTSFSIEAWRDARNLAGGETYTANNRWTAVNVTSYNNFSVDNAIYSDTLWSCQACDSDNECGFAPENYTIFIDRTLPSMIVSFPTGKYDFGKVGENLTLNWTVSDAGGNLDMCWYEYNNVNTTINCSTNTTTFAIASLITKSLKFWANDSMGNLNYEETNWSYYLFENSATYNSQALETSSQTFTTNLTLDNTSIQSAYLVYNNTLYTASIDLEGNQSILSRTITVPEVSITTNFSFFWEVNLNSPQVNTTLQNQTVVAFTIDNCSVNSILVVNNTLVDEETQNKITGNSTIEVEVTLRNENGITMGTLSKIYYNTSYAPVCVNALYNTTIYVDIITSYIAENYAQEFWYLDNGLLNQSNWYLDEWTSKNVTLRDLKLDDSETFLFKYYDANFLITEGAIVQVLRDYIGEGVFKEAERCKLDANGECHLHLVGEDVIYEFRIIINGIEDYLSGNYNAKCVATPCSITLQKGTTTDEWDIEHDNLAEGTYTLTTDEDNRTVTLTFNLAETGEMQLDVFTYTNDPNTQDTLVATDTVIAKSGTASVLIPLSYGNITYYAVVRHNDAFVTTQWVDLNEDGYKYFGALGLFLGALIVLSLGLIAISSGGWTIVFIILGLIIASITKLVNMGYYLLMFVVCAGGLIIWRLASRRSL
jgi:hypothetical protein